MTVTIRSKDVPPEGSRLQVRLGPGAKGRQGTQTAGTPQEVSLDLEVPFFIADANCIEVCDPDAWNPFVLTGPLDPREWREQIKVTRISEATPVITKPTRSIDDQGSYYWNENSYHTSLERPESFQLALSDAGYELRPAATYRVEVPASLTTQDGRVLGYPFVADIENGHRHGIASMGTGFGIWEKNAGTVVPLSIRNLSSVREWVAPLKIEDVTPLISSGQSLHEPSSPGRERALGWGMRSWS